MSQQYHIGIFKMCFNFLPPPFLGKFLSNGLLRLDSQREPTDFISKIGANPGIFNLNMATLVEEVIDIFLFLKKNFLKGLPQNEMTPLFYFIF